MVARSSSEFGANTREVIRIILLISLAIVSCAKCEIIPQNSANDGESSSSLVIQVLRNYENTWKVASDISESSSDTVQCQGDVETVLTGYTENDFWAMKSEWKDNLRI